VQPNQITEWMARLLEHATSNLNSRFYRLYWQAVSSWVTMVLWCTKSDYHERKFNYFPQADFNAE
jgi:hypothetical protein